MISAAEDVSGGSRQSEQDAEEDGVHGQREDNRAEVYVKKRQLRTLYLLSDTVLRM